MKTRNRIVVVDDEHSVIDILRESFETASTDILTANSAEEALQLIRMAPIDIVISDIKMPGMSGLELASEIEEIQTCQPFLIYLTATPMDAQEMYTAGADAFVRKPINFDLLEAMIKHFLKRARINNKLRWDLYKCYPHLTEIENDPGATDLIKSHVSEIKRLLPYRNS